MAFVAEDRRRKERTARVRRAKVQRMVAGYEP
jgi:hypothetical protein